MCGPADRDLPPWCPSARWGARCGGRWARERSAERGAAPGRVPRNAVGPSAPVSGGATAGRRCGAPGVQRGVPRNAGGPAGRRRWADGTAVAASTPLLRRRCGHQYGGAVHARAPAERSAERRWAPAAARGLRDAAERAGRAGTRTAHLLGVRACRDVRRWPKGAQPVGPEVDHHRCEDRRPRPQRVPRNAIRPTARPSGQPYRRTATAPTRPRPHPTEPRCTTPAGQPQPQPGSHTPPAARTHLRPRVPPPHPVCEPPAFRGTRSARCATPSAAAPHPPARRGPGRTGSARRRSR